LGKSTQDTESTLHDYPIYEISAAAESLSYKIEETHLGIEQGPDLVIRNPTNQLGVIIKSEVGHNITDQSYTKFEREGRQLRESNQSNHSDHWNPTESLAEEVAGNRAAK
jgi:hypothetical protein